MSMDDETADTSNTASADGTSDKSTPWRDEQRLRTLRIDQRQSHTEMAEELGCSKKTVLKWLRKYGIEAPDPPWRDKSVLKQLREEGLSQQKIGERLGCSATTVKNWMHTFDMETNRPKADERWRSKARLNTLYIKQELTIQEVADELDCHWHTIRSWLDTHGIETRSRNPDLPDELRNRDTLSRLYRDEEMSTHEIADRFDCGPSTVHGYLDKHDIETRDVGSQPGSLHHRWKGGYEPYYGENWHKVRRDVLERDDYRCQSCGCTNDEHERSHGSGLDVHHKRPFRTFDEPENANTMDNLVSLCRSCHNKIEDSEQRS
ncbi:hypothetical protein BRC71_07490 [Halobacteriales archaeon QH_7_65_31]|nr:MAG: hypothetical protein BRC71_07490 [Halobacteriales archaeon QH_7_65_31]